MEIALRKTRAMHLRQHRQHGGQNVQGARISCRWRIQSRPVGRERFGLFDVRTDDQVAAAPQAVGQENFRRRDAGGGKRPHALALRQPMALTGLRHKELGEHPPPLQRCLTGNPLARQQAQEALHLQQATIGQLHLKRHGKITACSPQAVGIEWRPAHSRPSKNFRIFRMRRLSAADSRSCPA